MISLFQSTHPHGVRRSCLKKRQAQTSFNPRTHTGCDLETAVAGQESMLFQSTHPHGVRLLGRIHDTLDILVSIHAPTRGATYLCSVTLCKYKVSIHAPTRGATWWTRHPCNQLPSFNPRTHTGCDLGQSAYETAVQVSIHAPTRGATTAHFKESVECFRFQSTHPHGVRLTLALLT